MNDTLNEIKKRIDIVDFIGSYITLKKAGRNFKAVCPFHQEKTPSFVVSPERQIWHCFGSCGDGGDIVKFLMKWENITFYEALLELAQKAGVKMQKVSFEDKTWKKKERLIQMNTLAADFFNYVLFKTNYGEKGLEYLKTREINSKIAQKFQIGYAPQSWDSLFSFLRKKKFEPAEIIEGGLIIQGEKGGYYDRFRGRLIFPIKDARGNTIAFAGRTLSADETEAKYVNSPETPVYHKRESLYGLDLAKEAIKKESNVYLVEGEFDVISPYQQGIENIVAIKGAAVTREQLSLLKRYVNRVTLALDADKSGEETVKRALENAQDLDFEMEVVSFKDAKDPDESVRKDPVAFKKALKKTIPIHDFIIDLSVRKHPGSDPYNKKQIGDEVVPFIEKISNPIVQSHYIKKLAETLDVSEGSISAAVSKLRQRTKKQYNLKSSDQIKPDQSREINIQRYVLSILFQSKEPYILAEKFFTIVSPEDFSIPAYVKIMDSFIKFKEKAKIFSLENFAETLPQELRPVFDELYLYASYDADLSEENRDKLLYEVKKNILKKQISQTMTESESSQSSKQDEALKALSLNLKEVEKKLLSL